MQVSAKIDPSSSPARIPPIIIAVAAVAALYGWAVVALTPSHPGSIGFNLNALGTDWMVFWGGAQQFFAGRLDALFDGGRFTDYLNANFAFWLSQPIQFRPWVYPPSYLLAILPFGALPFLASYLVFQLASAALFALALCYAGPRPHSRALLVAAALFGPAAAINVGMGQNAFLTAALMVAGFRLVPVRPVLGGAILGLLTIKPQFCLLVPVALIAGREWKALLGSAVAAGALAFASLAVFGLDVWRHWLELAGTSYADPNGPWVELGRMWGDSVYACLAAAGASQAVANGGQLAATLLGIGLAYAAFRLPLSADRRLAVMLAATILAAPHSSLADTVLLATAAALWADEAAADRVSLGGWVLPLALWLSPVFNPPLVSPLGRLTPLLIIGFIAMLRPPAANHAANRATNRPSAVRRPERASPEVALR